MIAPYLAMPAALGVLLALMLSLKWWQRRRNPSPELVRKLLHVGMGMVVLPFPWVFEEAWPVVVLAAAAVVLMLASRVVPGLKRGVGTVTGSVARSSLGEVYYPIAIAVLFVLHRDPLLFVIPVLILALADAVAALIGITYGRLHYEGEDGIKSAEGSVAFFTVAFLSVHVPLLLLTSTGRAETLLIALMLGLLVMMMEAIAWRGLDNLFIPLGAYALLVRYLPLTAAELLVRLGVTVALVVFVFFFRQRSTLTDAGLLGAALFGYAAYALGGELWVLPPLLLFLCHACMWPKCDGNTSRHDVHTVVSTTGPGLLWLLAYARTENGALLLPFVTLFAAHVAIIAISWLPPEGWGLRKVLGMAGAMAGSALLAGVVIGAAIGAEAAGWGQGAVLAAQGVRALGIIVAASGVGAVLFAMVLPRLLDRRRETYLHIHHVGGAMAFVGSLVAYGMV